MKTQSLKDFSDIEITILKLAAKGLSNREIAGQIFVSSHTVKSYLAKIMKKTEPN